MTNAALHSTPLPVQRGLLVTTRKFLELIRFSHTIFALPFALLATIWAYAVPLSGASDFAMNEAAERLPFRVQDLIGILVCMVLARSFAMAFNRLLDHRIDAANPRTANRHLPRGDLSRRGVVLFSVLCAVFFVAACLLFLPNRWPLVLSVPVLLFLAGYSLTKRFTRLAHFWLGVALMLAPVCVWIALRGSYLTAAPADLLPAVWLGGIVMFWTAGFDIIYACQDYEFDRDAGLFSIPAKLGIKRALWVARFCHLVMWCMALGMSWLFPALGLGWLFQIAMIFVGFLLFWEHASVSERSLEKINLAFFQLNGLISLIFLVVGGIDAIW